MHSCILCLSPSGDKCWLRKRQKTAATGECGKLFRCRNRCCRQSRAYNRLCAPPQHGRLSLVDGFISSNQNVKGEYGISDFSTPLRGVPFSNSKVHKLHKNFFFSHQRLFFSQKKGLMLFGTFQTFLSVISTKQSSHINRRNRAGSDTSCSFFPPGLYKRICYSQMSAK